MTAAADGWLDRPFALVAGVVLLLWWARFAWVNYRSSKRALAGAREALERDGITCGTCGQFRPFVRFERDGRQMVGVARCLHGGVR